MELIIKDLGKTQDDFLTMQRNYYDADGAKWSESNPDPVVGNWDAHSHHPYEEYLFKGIDNLDKKDVLEYGCGPGRNLIRFSPLVKAIFGVDISQTCLNKAEAYRQQKGLANVFLLPANNGSNLSGVANDFYDLVFSVICLQHICSWSVRFSIFKEINRVLKKEGIFTAQMGFGGRPNAIPYAADFFDAGSTNGSYDVSVMSPTELEADLDNAGFYDFKYDLREPCADVHAKWIWFQVKKK